MKPLNSIFLLIHLKARMVNVFVRTVVENDVKVTLLRSKARVAPLKSLTIPRLELMSCCLGARLANSIIRALNLPGIKVIYWSDSKVALWWIREQGNWSVFVANRVKEIRELTQFQSWRHVPSNMNIADLLSRGCTPKRCWILNGGRDLDG
ncbi:integrase catalytic domain-containing protein [Trichonephila clavipes]|nr:integrase catalytic domain-containing protein [Trichonephila clavipes]